MGGTMRISRALSIAWISLAICCAAAAQGPRSVLGYVDSVSFWVGIPDGWQVDQATAKQLGALLILLPQNSTFRSAPFLVVASAFHNISVDAAMSKDKASFQARDPDIVISDESSITSEAGQQFSVREFRSAKLRNQPYETVAYAALGPHVLVLSYSAQTEPQYQAGLPAFQGVLKSYAVGPKVTHQ
jgi:hypothetical protein